MGKVQLECIRTMQINGKNAFTNGNIYTVEDSGNYRRITDDMGEETKDDLSHPYVQSYYERYFKKI